MEELETTEERHDRFRKEMFVEITFADGQSEKIPQFDILQSNEIVRTEEEFKDPSCGVKYQKVSFIGVKYSNVKDFIFVCQSNIWTMIQNEKSLKICKRSKMGGLCDNITFRAVLMGELDSDGTLTLWTFQSSPVLDTYTP